MASASIEQGARIVTEDAGEFNPRDAASHGYHRADWGIDMEILFAALAGLALGLLFLFWQRGRWLADVAQLREQAAGLRQQLDQERRSGEERRLLVRRRWRATTRRFSIWRRRIWRCSRKPQKAIWLPASKRLPAW